MSLLAELEEMVVARHQRDDDLTSRDLQDRMRTEILEAEAKAWDSLSRYKFWMFGYYASRVVFLSQLQGGRRRNPFKALVELARVRQETGRKP